MNLLVVIVTGTQFAYPFFFSARPEQSELVLEKLHSGEI